MMQLILEALSNPQGGDYWYIAPTYRQAKNIAWRMLLAVWFSLPRQLRGKKNEAELWVEVGKSRISLKGADDEDSLRGSGLWGVIFDEVATYRNWKYLWGEVLRPALSDYKGFGWFISTPKGYNHFYDLHLKELNDKDYQSFHFTSYDNPYLNQQEIEKAKQELTEDAFGQEYLADFRKHTGLIYKEFDRSIHVVDPFELPTIWRFYRAMDFGAVNPTVCLWIAVDTNENIYIFDEYFNSGQRTESHANVVKEKNNYPIVATWGDPSGEQAILDYAQYGIYITPATKVFEGDERGWVKSGIEKVGQLLKVHPQTGRPRLFISKNCPNTIREFEGYRWLEHRDELNAKEIPEKVNDHAMDAFRYFVVSYAAKIQSEAWSPAPIATNPFTGYGSR